MTLVDANVLLDLFTNDKTWAEWSRDRLSETLTGDGACINAIIYAEISLAFAHERELDTELQRLRIRRLALPYEAAFAAGRAFLSYRRNGGERRSPLPDFYIGAHASQAKLVLLTRDARRYRTYFPDVSLVAPEIS